ncbi:hypothetical protein COY05_00710 [Candidatus Peregrinibacteria bacterium CG_4_10_14_0_2_um_filter_38_24]|nr:MAG: hypothetical protein COY05_00710 [Candidatus Peregrinibacteria bacterium CG_4_10_14_0_2_um_filter_38_24]PJC39398.1 MAG: hypothetical protein CO044_00075 [Candidatus Peregrinibacteria bacterium CG_4_9_14_0_2_um_filter_38_9]
MNKRKIYILIIAILLGSFIVIEGRSFDIVNNIILRDSKSDVFKEIKVLKEGNQNLMDEIKDLEATLSSLSDKDLAVKTIQNEIEKYNKLSGEYAVYGSGVSISVSGKITAPWMVDLINELFHAGAQAVSINSIRITNESSGFDTLPKGQIYIDGTILSPPYVFNAIGEAITLNNALSAIGGIFDRIRATFGGVSIVLEQKDVMEIN